MEVYRPDNSLSSFFTQLKEYVDYVGEAVLRELKLNPDIYEEIETFKREVIEIKNAKQLDDQAIGIADEIIGKIEGIQAYMGRQNF